MEATLRSRLRGQCLYLQEDLEMEFAGKAADVFEEELRLLLNHSKCGPWGAQAPQVPHATSTPPQRQLPGGDWVVLEQDRTTNISTTSPSIFVSLPADEAESVTHYLGSEIDSARGGPMLPTWEPLNVTADLMQRHGTGQLQYPFRGANREVSPCFYGSRCGTLTDIPFLSFEALNHG